MEEILRVIREVCGLGFEWKEAKGDRDADYVVRARSRSLNIEKSRKELGFAPQYSRKQGIKEYYEWWKDVTRKCLWGMQ